MRLLLFGAGASHGSEHTRPYCPPVGEALFEDLHKLYPQAWGALPSDLRAKFVPNFETGMGELWESRPHDVPTLLRCVADYFARFRPLQGNAYTRVLDHLDARGALKGTFYSSLNYDCVFEYAARDFDLTIDYFASEPSTGKTLTLWKIHGSCNFLPTSVTGAASNVDYSASAVIFNGGVRVVDAAQVGPFVSQNAFYPAMAVYMVGKPMHSCPSVLRELQSRWASAVLASDTVGLIGVRPNPPDAHIWDPLSATRARIVAIGNREAYQDWAKANRPGKPTTIIGHEFARDLSVFADEFSGTRLE